jgi:membrane protease YdiL (CAAX protease family)
MTALPFWHPALQKAQIWRTLLGFVTIMAIWLFGTLAILQLAARLTGRPLYELAGAGDFGAAAAFFLTFAGFHVGLLLVLPVLHRRGYRSLFGPTRRLNLRHFGFGVAVTVVLAMGLYSLMIVEHLVLPEGVAPEIARGQPVTPWLIGLIPALALILFQTFAEEAVFRGYLLQQLRARFRSVWVWGILPSLAFGALHFDAASFGVINASAYVLNATVMGTLAALVTLRTGNLGAAAGLHFGNNAALVLIGIGGNLDGFSLWLVQMDLQGGYTTYSILTQTVAMLLVYLVWGGWMGRHRPIAKDQNHD